MSLFPVQPTKLNGNTISAASMAPDDALALRKDLQKSRELFVVETDLHAIYLVTPLPHRDTLSNLDWTYYMDLWEKLPAPMRRVGDVVGVREGNNPREFYFQLSE